MSEETKWYSLRVISGKERKIKERIDLELLRSGWQDIVPQVIVPTEKVYKVRNGKKVISERNILPGYILVEAVPQRFSGEIVAAIGNVQNVIHFLGKTNPLPMQQAEANRLLGKVDASQDAGAPGSRAHRARASRARARGHGRSLHHQARRRSGR